MSEAEREPRPVYAGACRYCGDEQPKTLFWKLKADAAGSYSLAGVQPKVSAYWWPYLRCEGCQHVSEGKVGVAVSDVLAGGTPEDERG